MNKKGMRVLLIIGLLVVATTSVSAQHSREGKLGLEINLHSNPTGVDLLNSLNLGYHLPLFFSEQVSAGPYLVTNWGSSLDYFEAGAIGKFYFGHMPSEGVTDYAKIKVGFNNIGNEGMTGGVGYGIEYSFNKYMAIGTNLTLDISPSYVRLSPGLSFRINH
jgi:hypothetical protein